MALEKLQPSCDSILLSHRKQTQRTAFKLSLRIDGLRDPPYLLTQNRSILRYPQLLFNPVWAPLCCWYPQAFPCKLSVHRLLLVQGTFPLGPHPADSGKNSTDLSALGIASRDSLSCLLPPFLSNRSHLFLPLSTPRR